MRVLPLLQTKELDERYVRDIVLPSLRAMAVSHAVAKYPARETELATRVATAAFVAVGPTDVTALTANAAAQAARAAALPNAFTAAARAAVYAAAAVDASAADTATFWSAVSDDAMRVEEGATASEIAGSPLWQRQRFHYQFGSQPVVELVKEQPDQLQSLWLELKAALVAANEHWDVWTDWYDDRLAGRVRDEERELAYVHIEEAVWNQGPAIVNAEIKKRIEGHTANLLGSFVSVGIQPARAVARAAGEHEPPLRVENVPSLDEQRPWSNTLANLPEVPLGNRWVESGNRLAIDPAGQETDDVAARDPVVCQLHEAVKRKARAFADAEADIDDRLGWTGFGDAIQRFLAAVDVDTAAIPSRIAAVYDATIELASFLDVDSELRLRPGSNISPLDPITRRSFLDLVRTAAPWIRRFPTACALDDETGAFLLRRDLYEPSLAIVEGARQTDLISADDRALLKGLLSAIEREGFPAQKAGKRGIQSAKSLTFAAVAIVVTLYSSGIESEFASHSAICKKAGAFLGQTEAQILQIVDDAPADIRHAISSLIYELRHGHGGSTSLDTGHSAIVERRERRDDVK